MSDLLKLSTALPGDQEINGLDALAAGLVETTKADKDRPDPHDCDHVDFTVERDHLEDVPEGMVRETCLRCGWVQYQPADTLEERMEAAGLGKDDAPTLSLVGGVGRSDFGEVFVFEGGEPE